MCPTLFSLPRALSRLAPRRASPRRPAFHRPLLEVLEDRCCPSGGTLDASFGTGGLATTTFNIGNSYSSAVLIQPDGKIVEGGASYLGSPASPEFTLVRSNTDGSQDATFGKNGIVQTAVSKVFSAVHGLTLENVNGVEKIVAVGQTWSGRLTKGGYVWAIARYNPNGTLDTSFNKTGIVVVNPGSASDDAVSANAVAIDGNGKIDVAGTSKGSNEGFTLMRFNANGTRDTTFGNNGIVTTYPGLHASAANALAIQADGKIVLAGEDYSGPTTNAMAAARYTTSGQLDSSFGTGGIVTVMSNWATADSMLLLGDGSILLGGTSNPPGQSSLTLAKLTSSGQIDTSFGSSGFATDSALGNAVAIGLGSNGDLLAADYTVINDSNGNRITAGPAVAAFLPGGTLDTTFGSAGTATANFGFSGQTNAMAIQADGKIVVAGGGYGFDLARFLPSLAAPQIGSFTANPNPVTNGSSVTLTASNITDSNAGATIAQVAFYTPDGLGHPQLLGDGIQNSDGSWSLTFNTVILGSGTSTLFAQAIDGDGAASDGVALTLTVQ